MPDRAPDRRFLVLCLLLLLVLSCGREGEGTTGPSPPSPEAAAPGGGEPGALAATALPLLDLSLSEGEVTIAPLPLRASFPFTVTAIVHNPSQVSAVDVPILVHIQAEQERVGYSPFLAVITASVPASQSIPIDVPVRWNLAGGKHQIWIEVNHLPEAWSDRRSAAAEADLSDNAVLLESVVEPFDAYSSDLCRGRVDVQVGPADVVPDPDRQRVRVRVHNLGNRAVYNLPVVVLGSGVRSIAESRSFPGGAVPVAGIAYTPVIPPCGGTAEVTVGLDFPLEEGEALTVQVNPPDWDGGLTEDDLGNNNVTLSVGLSPGMVVPPGGGLDEYDFGLEVGDIETPEPWIVEVTVHNRGTRDAAMVPIRVENEAGRAINDAIPLVRGGSLGVAALRVGYLWTRGGTLTFTVNPAEAKGAFPEAHREDNVATFVLP